MPFVEHTDDISRTTASYITGTDVISRPTPKQFTCQHSTEYDSSEFQNLIPPVTCSATSPEII